MGRLFLNLLLMFGRLQDVVNNVLNADEDKLFVTVIGKEKVKDLIVKLNTVEQLFKQGVNYKGNSLGVYSELTEEINEGRTFSVEGESRKKIAGETYILFEDGDFYNSVRVRVYKDYFTVESVHRLDDGREIADKFKNILGLTTESKNELGKEIIPEVRKEAKKVVLA